MQHLRLLLLRLHTIETRPLLLIYDAFLRPLSQLRYLLRLLRLRLLLLCQNPQRVR
jgi:hypothetical protein